MGSERTFWHAVFATLLRQFGPPGLRITEELPLSSAPQRADFLLLYRPRRTDTPARRARILPKLWRHLPVRTIVEFKSVGRPLRRGDLPNLLGLAGQYHAREHRELTSVRDLAMLLVITAATPTLDRELAAMGWMRHPLGSGYYRLTSSPYAGWLVIIDEVSAAEEDALLDLAGRRRMMTLMARRWLERNMLSSKKKLAVSKLEGYDKITEDIVKRAPLKVRLKGLKPRERLQGLKPRERLQGLKPRERLQDLSRAERLLCNDDDVLRQFPSQYIATLPPKVRAEVYRRIGKR